VVRLDKELRRLLSCPFCRAGHRLLVEEEMEGYFRCLQCDRRFVLPSTIEEANTEPNVLKRVMP